MFGGERITITNGEWKRALYGAIHVPIARTGLGSRSAASQSRSSSCFSVSGGCGSSKRSRRSNRFRRLRFLAKQRQTASSSLNRRTFSCTSLKGEITATLFSSGEDIRGNGEVGRNAGEGAAGLSIKKEKGGKDNSEMSNGRNKRLDAARRLQLFGLLDSIDLTGACASRFGISSISPVSLFT